MLVLRKVHVPHNLFVGPKSWPPRSLLFARFAASFGQLQGGGVLDRRRNEDLQVPAHNISFL